MSQIVRAANGNIWPGHGAARVCAAEWTRLSTVRSTWWSLLAATVVMVGISIIIGAEAANDPPSSHPRPMAWLAAEVALLPALFPLLTMVLLAVTSEYRTAAISTTLQWTPRRPILFLARGVVAVALAVLAGMLLTVAAGVAAWMSFPELQLAGLTGSLGRVAVILAGTGLLVVGIGFLLRSAAGTLAAVFLFVLVLPFALPLLGVEWLTSIATYLPGAAVWFLLPDVYVELDSLTATSATTILALWAGAALAAGGLSFVRRDSV